MSAERAASGGKARLEEYGAVVSHAFGELSDQFGAIAAPTLSKQETVTFLYQRVVEASGGVRRRRSTMTSLKLHAELVLRVTAKFVALLAASIRFRARSLPANAVYFRTWLVPRSFSGGGVKDDYFGRLPTDARKSAPVILAYQPLALGDYFRGFRGRDAGPESIITLGLLSVGDVISLVASYLRTARVRVTGEHRFEGKDIAPLINDSLNLDYFKLRSFQAYLDRAISERVRELSPLAFIYIFENQSWEQACLLAFRGTRTVCIGYQSSGFSERFLNFFPNRQDASERQFPVAILAVGELFADVLRAEGSYAVPVIPFAATRFDYPVANGKYIVESPSSTIHGRMLYAFAVHQYQYDGIIDDLTRAFAGTGVEVELKFHPVFAERYEGMNLPPNFRAWKPGRAAALKDIYDVVLFNDNSVGFEALLQGVKAFEYKCEAVYEDHRLYGFDVYDCVLDYPALADLATRMNERRFDKSYPLDRVAEYINRAYTPYSPAAADELMQLVGRGPAQR